MTKKEKILVGLLAECEKWKDQDQKELLKFIHTINTSFDEMSPFSWSEHHGGKKTKIKLKKLYN
jgi:hypothetical protein